ncbi:MAG: hypothetical protein SFU25_04185, partial [Candidatus Caenarcaniphilales bacterium]|nr:hypothetical protein [Candidatus Caenarcaniphilales bacterium]
MSSPKGAQDRSQQPQQKKQRIALRSDLDLTYYPDGSVQIRDPKAIRYFHLGFDEAEIIKMLAEMHPLEIVHRTSYTEDELKHFLGMLKQWGLLEGTEPPPRQTTKQKTVLQLMFSRFQLMDPDELLGFLVEKISWLWSKPAKVIACVMFAVTIVKAFSEGVRFASYGWPLIAESWGITLVCFLTMLFLVLLGHEFCHGLALKRFGGT